MHHWAELTDPDLLQALRSFKVGALPQLVDNSVHLSWTGDPPRALLAEAEKRERGARLCALLLSEKADEIERYWRRFDPSWPN